MVLYDEGTTMMGAAASPSAALYLRMNSRISSGCFSLEWIMMPDAPARVYASARLSASSMPAPAMSASMRAITMKSASRRAASPAWILAQKASISSSCCVREVPNSEFCLSPVLSSMMHAETPSCSRARTVNLNISGAPPVSAS